MYVWKGSDMTRMSAFPEVVELAGAGAGPAARSRVRPAVRPRELDGRRAPGRARPVVVGPRYSSTGVRLSRAPHHRDRNRQLTPLTVVGLALLAGLITMWLGAVAQFGEAVRESSAAIPDRLAVVQVRDGETLQHLAARVAPDAPVNSVVERIRELNELESAVLGAGQTLIAPVG